MNISSPSRASARRGQELRAERAALMTINGSLTEINVEIQRAEHTQANPNVKTTKPLSHAIKPIVHSKSETTFCD